MEPSSSNPSSPNRGQPSDYHRTSSAERSRLLLFFGLSKTRRPPYLVRNHPLLNMSPFTCPAAQSLLSRRPPLLSEQVQLQATHQQPPRQNSPASVGPKLLHLQSSAVDQQRHQYPHSPATPLSYNRSGGKLLAAPSADGPNLHTHPCTCPTPLPSKKAA